MCLNVPRLNWQLVCIQRTDRGGSVHMHFICWFFFFCLRQAYLVWMLKKMGGKETIVLSVHLANHTTWVRPFTRSWKHSYSCVTRWQDLPSVALCCQRTPLRKLWQGSKNKILLLLTLLVRAALYHPLIFLDVFFFFMKKSLSLDYHLTSCTHSSNQMLPCDMLCVFSPFLSDSMVFFLPL